MAELSFKTELSSGIAHFIPVHSADVLKHSYSVSLKCHIDMPTYIVIYDCKRKHMSRWQVNAKALMWKKLQDFMFRLTVIFVMKAFITISILIAGMLLSLKIVHVYKSQIIDSYH